MAIQSAAEFEAILNNVVVRIEKALVERGQVDALETAARELKLIFHAARNPAKLKAQRQLIDKVTDSLAIQIPGDNNMLEQLWDLADYIDYRA
jgi:alpha-glucuronidase